MEKLTESIVQRLVRLNMERLERFHDSMHFVEDMKVKKLLLDLAAQSEGFVMELEYVLRLYGGSVGEAASQKIMKTAFDKNTTDSIQAVFLILLEQEQKDIRTYSDVLDKGRNLDNDLFEKIRSQKVDLLDATFKLKCIIKV